MSTQQESPTIKRSPLPSEENAPRAVMESVVAKIAKQVETIGLPCNLELERETICAIMLGDPKYTALMMASLKPSDFASPVHALIFDTLLRGWETGIPFNTPATLVQWVRDSGLLIALRRELGESRLDVECLLKVMQANGLAVHAEYYAITLRRLKMERDIWLLLREAVDDAKCSPPMMWLEKYRAKISAMLPP